MAALTLALGLVVGCTSVSGIPEAAEPGASSSTSGQPSGATDTSVGAVDGEADLPDGPTSAELISAALDAGDIDEPTSLLYRLWASFGDRALPDEYQGTSEPHDLGFFVDLQDSLDDLPGEIRTQVEPYLKRPSEPDSIFTTDNPLDEGPPGFRSSTLAPSLIETPSAKTDDSVQWRSAAVPGLPFRVWAPLKSTGEIDLEPIDTDTDTDTDTSEATDPTEADVAEADGQIALVAAVLTAHAGTMIDEMGAPMPDKADAVAGLPADEADNKIDVYVLPPGWFAPYRGGESSNIDGAFRALAIQDTADGTDAARPWAESGYLLVGAPLLDDPLRLESSLVHEVFHVLQYAHHAYLDSRWFYEASAVWASTHYVRAVAPKIHGVQAPLLQASELALHTETPMEHPYSAYLWPLFMEQEAGPEAVFATWQALEHADAGTADEVIDAFNPQMNVEAKFPDFVVRLFNADLPGNPIQPRFVDVDSTFPDGMRPPLDARTLGDEPLEIDYTGVRGLAYDFAQVTVPPPNPPDEEGVLINIAGDVQAPDGPEPSLTALVRGENGEYQRQSIEYLGDGTDVCVAGELILVFANVSTDAFAETDGMIQLTYVMDEEGAKKLCGRVEVTHPETLTKLADGEVVRISGTEGDGEPDHAPVVISVFDAVSADVDSYQVDVTLTGGTLNSPRKLSWPLGEFELLGENGGLADYRKSIDVALDLDLTDGIRDFTIDARLARNQKKIDDHAPTAELRGGACLVGDWVIPQAEMQRFYDAMDVEATFVVRGNTGLTFTKTNYEYTPNFTLGMKIKVLTTTISLSGSISGNYGADGSIITTSHDRSDLSAVAQVMGKTIDAAEMLGDMLAASPISSAPYQCRGAAPVLMFATGGPDRVPIQLQPAP